VPATIEAILVVSSPTSPYDLGTSAGKVARCSRGHVRLA